MQEKWRDEWTALQADKFGYRAPNGENYPDMFDRARPFLDEIAQHPAERIAIVSHGMIGKVMMGIALGLNDTQTLAINQANDVIFITAQAEGASTLSHYIGGEGPFHGTPGRAIQTSA